MMLYETVQLFLDNKTTIGIDYQRYGGNAKNIIFNSDFGEHFQNEFALYVNTQQMFLQQLILNGGLRYEHNNIFGNVVVPQAGVAYHLSEATTVRGSVSKSFRSPTIMELYLFAPTTTLQPEEMWNYEIGISQTFSNRISLDLVGFVNEGSNLIRMTRFAPGGRVNSGSFIHRGVEFSGSFFASSDLQLHTSYSYLDPGKETRSVPKHKIFLSGDYVYRITTFSLSIQHIEGIYGNDNNQDRLGNYTQIGSRISAQVLPQLSVNLSVDNLLDEKYQTILGYPMPGRTFTIGMQTRL
jgi:iron complex outermembrane receptor protein